VTFSDGDGWMEMTKDAGSSSSNSSSQCISRVTGVDRASDANGHCTLGVADDAGNYRSHLKLTDPNLPIIALKSCVSYCVSIELIIN